MTRVIVVFLVSALFFSLPARANFELGASVGTPAGINLHLGSWSPFLVRASGMHWAGDVWGGQAELGYTFDREGQMWQYVSLGAVASNLGGKGWHGAGPFYGLNASGFFMQIGITRGSGSFPNPQLALQIGFSTIFGREAKLARERTE